MDQDRIELNGLRAFGHHGALDEERARGQVLVLDVALELDLAPAASSDALTDTVHYGELAERLVAAVDQTSFSLLEALAGHLLELAMSDERVSAATVRLTKPHAPIAADVASTGVVLRRERSVT
ncbi:MAG: dihydroneopterin aldolase [Egibacteraceae bacterium]